MMAIVQSGRINLRAIDVRYAIWCDRQERAVGDWWQALGQPAKPGSTAVAAAPPVKRAWRW